MQANLFILYQSKFKFKKICKNNSCSQNVEIFPLAKLWLSYRKISWIQHQSRDISTSFKMSSSNILQSNFCYVVKHFECECDNVTMYVVTSVLLWLRLDLCKVLYSVDNMGSSIMKEFSWRGVWAGCGNREGDLGITLLFRLFPIATMEEWFLIFSIMVNMRQMCFFIQLNGWQLAKNEKRVFLTCPCHEIYRDEALGLKSLQKYLKKLRYLWKCEIWGNIVKIWYFVNNCFIKAWI